MHYLSESDYAELKSYTLEQLEKYREELREKLVVTASSANNLTQGQSNIVNQEIDELCAWINAYSNEITFRNQIHTPPTKKRCIGCEEGHLNQQGHYGGCIDDPFSE